MEKKKIGGKRVGHAVTLLLLSLIALLTGLAFLPISRNRRLPRTVVYATDSEAVRALDACRAYADAHDFSTELSGAIKARAFGIPYSQHVSGSREKTGSSCVEIAESRSALAKAALRKETDGDVYKITVGDFKGKSAVYGEPTEYTRDGFMTAYGKPNTGLVKYELDGAIVEAETLGDGAYRFALDACRATRFCRNEVKTSLGGKSFPDYESIEFTLYTDGERPVKVVVTEKFRIDKFGGTECTAEYTEVFKF